MTNEEAIKGLLNVKMQMSEETPFTEAVDLAVSALEKQIPKEVIHCHHCPQCDNGLPVKKITNNYCSCCFNWSYCPHCGQALKWKNTSRRNESGD